MAAAPEFACVRRYELNSPILTAVPLGEVYAIEARIRGCSAEERRAVRQAETKPIMDALKTRLMTALAELPSRSSLVEAIKYMLGHWAGLTLLPVSPCSWRTGGSRWTRTRL